MAFTAGLLLFLGVEALPEAFELQALLPSGLGGSRARPARGRAELPRHDRALGAAERRQRRATGFALALLVAIGIGVHNFGEGLAIGASFAIGELQLGRS